ncbi:unnamed protein product [Linum tenue]|uniref:Glycosyltransferase 61 catalytic domain-containing protein n=3 Tax=Linum tenue TaxID=586396 RepID=A0AAV0I068_9ROSI|nr:unnamed protein product [Linum tenue]
MIFYDYFDCTISIHPNSSKFLPPKKRIKRGKELERQNNSSPVLSFCFRKTGSEWGPQSQPAVNPSPGITCDRSHKSYDFCTIDGPTVLDPATSTFHATGPSAVHRIKPYPRKAEAHTMKRIRELTLQSGPTSPQCQIQHGGLPAVVFSAGGYTGNFFHDFSEGFIPLFVTVNALFPSDRDIVLVVSEAGDWWIRKYADLLRSFTKHPIVVIGNGTAAAETHCFGSATVGLIYHGMATVNPNLMPGGQNLTQFRLLLQETYGGGGRTGIQNWAESGRRRPRLVLVARPMGIGRGLLNEQEVRAAAEKVGFEVVRFLPRGNTTLREAFAVMDSADAMVGVHGAAMTHLLFLRPGAAFLQVVPLGTEWAAEVCYGGPAKAMGLEYVEYRITVAESSLAAKFDPESLVLKDPPAYRGKDWSKMWVYLREQNVRIDLVRFREYLETVYEKAEKFMRKNG